MDILMAGVGNRLWPDDALGCLVIDRLAQQVLPPGVELLDAGLRGLDLLPLLAGRRRVIFADALAPEVCVSPGVTCLAGEQVAALATTYGHGAGLPFLLAMLPKILPPPRPACWVVGAAGHPTPALVEAVALACLEMANDP